MSIIAGATATPLGTCVAMQSPAAPLSAPALGFDNFVSVHGTPLTVPFETPLEPIPEVDIEPVGLVGRVARFLDRFSKNGAPRPKKSVSKEEFFKAIRPGNPFGIYGDGKGNWIFPAESRDSILNHFGTKRVVAHEGNILEFKIVGIRDRVFMHQKTADDPAPKFRLDYRALAAPEYARGTPIVFYHDESRQERRTPASSTIEQWVHAQRELGHNIVYVKTLGQLRSAVETLRPSAVLVSAVEDHIRFAYRAFYVAKEIDPSIVTIAGGIAVIPQLAKLYDIVVRGEGQIALPLILNRIYQMIGDGELKAPQKSSRDLNYPPLFSEEAAQSIAMLSAARFIDSPNGPFVVRAPIGVDPGGAKRVFVKGENGTVTASVSPVSDRYDETAQRWKEQFGATFPLSRAQFAIMTFGIPVTSDEYDSLFARNVTYRSARSNHSIVYVQSGCRGDHRCAFCSIFEKASGRRASVEQIIRIMKQARIEGMTSFGFVDDLFIQNRAWVIKLMRRIKEERLDEALEIHFQTRADTLLDDETLDTLAMLKDLRVAVGIETLSSKRARNMRKLGEAGDEYVKHAKAAMERLMKRGIQFGCHMILASPGDKLTDIGHDVLEQFRAREKLWHLYRAIPLFTYNPSVIPNYGSAFSETMSGLPLAQPEGIPVNGRRSKKLLSKWRRFPRVTLGGVKGIFFPFGISDSEKGARVEGIFKPEEFIWPNDVSLFLKKLPAYRGPIGLVDLYRALKSVMKSGVLTDADERKEFAAIMAQIEILHDRWVKGKSPPAGLYI